MFTPTPPTQPQPTRDARWEIVKVELVKGPRGKASIAWLAAQGPLRMQWRVGERTFKNATDAQRFAEEVTGLRRPN